MEIFAEALKILAADVLLFGVFSVVGLLVALWLVFGNKPLKKWLAKSVPPLWATESKSFRIFFYAFFIILTYVVGASFRAAADEWISAKPKWHLNLKDIWLLRDYAYSKQHGDASTDKDDLRESYVKDARKHTDKALKIYSLADLVDHAEHGLPKTVNSTLACRLKTYRGSAIESITKAKICDPIRTIGNANYEAIEEVSRFYHTIREVQIARESAAQNKLDVTTGRANLVIDFARLAAFLFFAVAIAAALAIIRKIAICLFDLNRKKWLPTVKAGWIAIILLVSLIGYLGSAAAWQALEVDHNKIIFRKYFAGGYLEKKDKATNPVLSEIDIELRDLGLLINTAKPNAEK